MWRRNRLALQSSVEYDHTLRPGNVDPLLQKLPGS